MLPGAEIIEKGLADLDAERETVESLLVSIGAPRLRRLASSYPKTPFPRQNIGFTIFCLRPTRKLLILATIHSFDAWLASSALRNAEYNK